MAYNIHCIYNIIVRKRDKVKRLIISSNIPYLQDQSQWSVTIITSNDPYTFI